MNWKPGDRAIINCPTSNAHGKETVVLTACCVRGFANEGPYVGHEVSAKHSCTGLNLIFEPHELKPIDDDYDGHQVTTWDELEDIWTPGVTV